MSDQTQRADGTNSDGALPEPVSREDVRDRLAEIRDITDEWIRSHTAQYDPFDWSDLEKRAVRRKAVCEAAIYLHVAENSGDLVTEELKELVVDRINDPRYYHLMARKPHEIHKFGYPIAYVAEHGELDEAAAETMDRSLKRPSVWGLERKPFRTLDIWHLCQLYGFDDHDIDHRSVLELSCGSFPFSPIESSRDSAYELTHIFLFYYSFGARGDRFPSEPMGYEYPETLVGLLLRYMSEENCDLVGELLFCGALERCMPPGLVRFGLAWLYDRIDESGFVPGPDDGSLPIGTAQDSPELRDLDMGEWDDESQAWGCNYHPTMVAAMMARALLDSWDELDQPDRRRDLDYAAQGPNLVKTGDLLTTLAAYDLKTAAETFSDLVETPVVEAFPDLFEIIVDFFEHQRRPDGEFGYWTDEKQVYLSMDDRHDEESFAAEMLAPTSQACREALDAYEARVGASAD